MRRLARGLVVLAAALCLSLAAQAKTFLWRIQNGGGIVYLLGSIHAARADFYPLPQVIEDAFDASDALAVEVDPARVMTELSGDLLAKARYPEADNLKNHLSPETWRRLTAWLEARQMSVEVLEHFKPWLVAVTLSQMQVRQQGLLPENGIDEHFLAKARGKKPIVELETVEDQWKLLDRSDKEGEALLLDALEGMEGLGPYLDQLTEAWRTGNENTVEGLLEKLDEDAAWRDLAPSLLEERNEKMVARIDRFLRSGSIYFVVVGAAHLVGQDGILDLLIRRRYHVEQL